MIDKSDIRKREGLYEVRTTKRKRRDGDDYSWSLEIRRVNWEKTGEDRYSYVVDSMECEDLIQVKEWSRSRWMDPILWGLPEACLHTKQGSVERFLNARERFLNARVIGVECQPFVLCEHKQRRKVIVIDLYSRQEMEAE